MTEPTRFLPLNTLRRRGHRGGAILPHRSIWRLALPQHRLAVGAVLALAFTGALAALQELLGAWWNAQLLWWFQALALPGRFVLPAEPADSLWALPTLQIDLPVSGVDGLPLPAQALATVVLWIALGKLPDAFKPGAYLGRFALLIHASAVVYFALWPASFPHSVAGHVGGGLKQMWTLMLLTPLLHLCTFYLFPFALWMRVLLTLLTLVYLGVLAPLLYASHAALLSHLGLVAMPVLHLLLGVMVPISGMVALYGWAMSWHRPAEEPSVGVAA